MKPIISIIVLFFISISLFAQQPEMLWRQNRTTADYIEAVVIPGKSQLCACKKIHNEYEYENYFEIWDYNQRELLQTMPLGEDHYSVREMEASPDGKFLLCTPEGYYAAEIFVYDLENSTFVRKDEPEQTTDMYKLVSRMRFISPTRYAAIVSGINKVQIYRVADGTLDYSIDFQESIRKGNEFSQNGEYFAAGFEDNSVEIYKTDDASLVKSLTIDSLDFIFAVDNNAEFIVYRTAEDEDGNRMLRVVDTETGEIITQWEMNYVSAGLLPDQKRLICAKDKADNYAILNIESPAFVRRTQSQFMNYIAAADPDSSFFIGVTKKRQLEKVDFITGDIEANMGNVDSDMHMNAVSSLKFSADGRYLLSGDYDGYLKMWSAEDGELIRTYDTGPAGINSMDIRDNNDGLVVAHPYDLVTYNINNQFELEEITKIPVPSSPINTVRFYPTKFYEVTNSMYDYSEFMWISWHGGIHTLPMGGGDHWSICDSLDYLQDMAFSPDGLTAIFASRSENIMKMKHSSSIMGSGFRFDRIIMAHPMGSGSSGINSVAFSPDGSLFMTVAHSFEAGIWDAQSNYKIRNINIKGADKGSTISNPSEGIFIDNNDVIISDVGGLVRIWDSRADTVKYCFEEMKEFNRQHGYTYQFAQIRDIELSPDRTRLAIADFHGHIAVFDISTINSVEDSDYSSDLSIYPNPASDYIFIDSDGPAERIDIYNSLGHCVESLRDHSGRIDVGGLAPGAYYINIMDSNNTRRGMFAIAR